MPLRASSLGQVLRRRLPIPFLGIGSTGAGNCWRSASTPAGIMTQLQNEEERGPIPGRPAGAEGAFLRVLCITDTYTLHNFPHVVQVLTPQQADPLSPPSLHQTCASQLCIIHPPYLSSRISSSDEPS
jgi:hypothetical protein